MHFVRLLCWLHGLLTHKQVNRDWFLEILANFEVFLANDELHRERPFFYLWALVSGVRLPHLFLLRQSQLLLVENEWELNTAFSSRKLLFVAGAFINLVRKFHCIVHFVFTVRAVVERNSWSKHLMAALHYDRVFFLPHNLGCRLLRRFLGGL